MIHLLKKIYSTLPKYVQHFVSQKFFIFIDVRGDIFIVKTFMTATMMDATYLLLPGKAACNNKDCCTRRLETAALFLISLVLLQPVDTGCPVP